MFSWPEAVGLTFKSRASYMQDGRTATPQMFILYMYF
jgi:hypothetical protein